MSEKCVVRKNIRNYLKMIKTKIKPSKVSLIGIYLIVQYLIRINNLLFHILRLYVSWTNIIKVSAAPANFGRWHINFILKLSIVDNEISTDRLFTEITFSFSRLFIKTTLFTFSTRNFDIRFHVNVQLKYEY